MMRHWQTRCLCKRCMLLRASLVLVAGLVLAVALAVFQADAQLATDINVNSSLNNCPNTATLIFAANGKRQSFLIVASSANTATIFIGKNNAVTTSTGIPVTAGQNFSDNSYIGSWFCIAASNQSFTAYETTR